MLIIRKLAYNLEDVLSLSESIQICVLRRAELSKKTYADSELLKDVTRYSRQELEVACEDFSNIIGSSPDNLVYKGTMRGGPEIAVISLCMKEEFWTGYLELYFQKEVIVFYRS